MEKNKTKRQSLTLTEKMAIIHEINSGKTQSCVAREKSIPRQTVNKIACNKSSIEEKFRTLNGNRKKCKPPGPGFDKIDTALLEWFHAQRSQNIPVNGPILLEKARDFAEKLNVSSFKASNGWFEKWKLRHGIKLRVLSGEAAAVDTTKVSSWFDEKWPNIAASYSEKDIFNCDETGLFWRLLPEKSLAFKSERCAGGKLSKERITVLLCCNMDGTEKLKPLVIGKSVKPRAFKRIRCNETLDVTYRANSKAWMTTKLFVDWLNELDQAMKQVRRNIALILDNCPSHPTSVNLSNVKLFYLPPNTTSVCQPLDQGIIQNFKVKYRGLLIRKIIGNLDSGGDGKVDILDAILMLILAWEHVQQQTMANCFRKAGFKIGVSEPDPEDFEAEEMLPISDYLVKTGQSGNIIEIENAFRSADENLITTEVPTEDEIVLNLSVEQDQNDHVTFSDDEDDEFEVVEMQSSVTSNESLQAIDVLKRFLMQQTTPCGQKLKEVVALEDFILRQHEVKRRQSLMTEFLKNP